MLQDTAYATKKNEDSGCRLTQLFMRHVLDAAREPSPFNLVARRGLDVMLTTQTHDATGGTEGLPASRDPVTGSNARQVPEILQDLGTLTARDSSGLAKIPHWLPIFPHFSASRASVFGCLSCLSAL